MLTLDVVRTGIYHSNSTKDYFMLGNMFLNFDPYIHGMSTQEDGIETNNRYINNLGVLTRGSSSLLNTDQIPATFWITNPQNTFIGNAAAASRAYGFW